MIYYVDRFEGEFALVQREDGVSGRIPRSELPEGTREGSVLLFQDGICRLDEEKETARRRALFRRLQKLKKRE